MVRNSLKYLSWKDCKVVTSELKTVYQAPTEEAALMALDAFAGEWNNKYPQISKSCRAHWEKLNKLFGYPQGHLYHECHRIAEQRDPCSHKETQSVPDRWLSTEGDLSGDWR